MNVQCIHCSRFVEKLLSTADQPQEGVLN